MKYATVLIFGIIVGLAAGLSLGKHTFLGRPFETKDFPESCRPLFHINTEKGRFKLIKIPLNDRSSQIVLVEDFHNSASKSGGQ